MTTYYCKKHPTVSLTDVWQIGNTNSHIGNCSQCAGQMVALNIPSPDKIKTRVDFDALSPADKMDFVRAGGQIVDQ